MSLCSDLKEVLTPYAQRIKGLADANDEIKADLDDGLIIYDSVTLVVGSYINTNVAVDSTVDISPVSNGGFCYAIIPCKEDDVFIVNGVGGTAPKAWTFTDEDYKKISGATANAITNTTITAPADGYLIFNSTTGSNPKVEKKTYKTDLNKEELDNHEERINALEEKVCDNVTRITDPHKLMWIMKSFSENGIGDALYTNRMCTTCKVKAGSTISAKSANGVKINFGYKIDDSKSTLDYYVTFNYLDIVVPYDCTIFLGAHTSPLTTLLNDSLLDKIDIVLDVVDYESKFSKANIAYFGNPIDVYYEGQHIDSTGWTLSTANIDAIHNAFDALVAESDGFISKTDIGDAWNGYHMYEYDTLPVGLYASGGLKVPKVAIVCCTHGNEKMSAYAMHYLLYDLVHNSSKNPALAYLRTNCQIAFIPIANPWGFINRSRWNENQVNLNRNFPTYNWAEYDDGDKSEYGGINYPGSAPASETQTQMIMEFLRKHYDAAFAVDIHTNGEDTQRYYEICTTIIPESSDKTSKDYNVQHSYVNPSKLQINRIKPWMDEKYGTALGNVFYGNVTYPEADRPTLGQWVRESDNMMGFTFEVLAGSSTSYLGNELQKYAPTTIKAAAEEIGNFLVAMLINCKYA